MRVSSEAGKQSTMLAVGSEESIIKKYNWISGSVNATSIFSLFCILDAHNSAADFSIDIQRTATSGIWNWIPLLSLADLAHIRHLRLLASTCSRSLGSRTPDEMRLYLQMISNRSPAKYTQGPQFIILWSITQLSTHPPTVCRTQTEREKDRHAKRDS